MLYSEDNFEENEILCLKKLAVFIMTLVHGIEDISYQSTVEIIANQENDTATALPMVDIP